MSTLNTNGNKIFAGINIATLIIGILLPVIFHNPKIYTPTLVALYVVLAVYTAVAALVGFKDTFETNDPWKLWFQIGSTFLNILVPAFFFGLSNNG